MAILVLPDFNMMATSAFIDPFRAANYLLGRRCFEWHFISPRGGPVRASNGMLLQHSQGMDQLDHGHDLVVVCSSWTPEDHAVPDVFFWLRRQERMGASLGGIDTGAFILAAAGLLDDHAAAMHFEHHASYAEVHAGLPISNAAISFSPRRFSCAGGQAAAELALGLLRQYEDPSLVLRVANYIYHPGPTALPEGMSDDRPEELMLPEMVAHAVRLMEDHIEDILGIAEIAARVGASQRQLERHFKQIFGVSPMRHYLNLRLDCARRMVTQTRMQMIEIAVACGFNSQEHFSRSYRQCFGIAPTRDRQVARIPFQFRPGLEG